MLSDEFVSNLFGPDDDDDEKFFNKKDKLGRKDKIAYHPNAPQTKSKKKKKKERKNLSVENKEKAFNSENSLIPVERRISLDISQFKIEKQKYGIENDYGSIEYKLKLCDVSVDRIRKLTSQMQFRLGEGGGECYYEIGVEDNGNALGISKEELEISLSVINTMALNLGCKAKITKLIQGKEGLIAEVYIKRDIYINKIEVTIGVLGEEGAGTSTLIGVLTNGKLDNGKGLARQNVFRHKHEILCGKTSSFSHQILGFDEKGELTNYDDLLKPSFSQIVNKSTKIINFYDMAGSPKTFNRTTISTLSNEYLNYLLFVISAKEPITNVTENLLRFIYNVDLPLITIINKIDLISDEELKKFVQNYKQTILKLNIELNKEKIPLVVRKNDDVALFSSNMDEKELSIIFLVSTLKWEGGLTLFKNFLGVLPDLNKTSDEQKQKEIELEKMEFDIHETIFKENKNSVILVGIISSGKLRIKSKCFLGPDFNGNFKMVEVCDIHCKKVNVAYSYKGQYCSVCIKSIGDFNTLSRDNVKKGMSLIDLRNTPIASRLFEIEIWTIDDTTKNLKSSYQPILNIKHIRQGVKIKNPDELFLFLSENKKVNDLENLIKDDDINLDNVKAKISKIKERIKNKNKNIININNINDINNNINDINNKNNNNINKNIKINKNNQKDKDKNKDKEKEDNLFKFSDEITIGPIDKKTRLVVEFLFNPEYISVGQKIIINDQSLKACGVITKIFK